MAVGISTNIYRSSSGKHENKLGVLGRTPQHNLRFIGSVVVGRTLLIHVRVWGSMRQMVAKSMPRLKHCHLLRWCTGLAWTDPAAKQRMRTLCLQQEAFSKPA